MDSQRPDTSDDDHVMVIEELARTAERMKRAHAIAIYGPNGKSHRLNIGFLRQMRDGHRLRLNEWKIVIELLLAQWEHNAVITVRESAPESLPEIREGQLGVLIGKVNTTTGGGFDDWCWYIYTYGTSDNTVRCWASRAGQQECENIDAIAKAKGVLPYQLTIVYDQETSIKGADGRSFEDVIVVDILIDTITRQGQISLRSRTMEDGPRFQLEILQALEKVQVEAEEKAESRRLKRKPSIQERLDQTLPRKLQLQTRNEEHNIPNVTAEE